MAGGKPVLGLAIGLGKPKPGAGGDPVDEGMDDMGMEDEGPDVVAARAFMDAVKGDDPQAVIDTLNTLMDAVEVDEAPAEPDGDEAMMAEGY